MGMGTETGTIAFCRHDDTTRDAPFEQLRTRESLDMAENRSGPRGAAKRLDPTDEAVLGGRSWFNKPQGQPIAAIAALVIDSISEAAH
jgi:hypothetical protein